MNLEFGPARPGPRPWKRWVGLSFALQGGQRYLLPAAAWAKRLGRSCALGLLFCGAALNAAAQPATSTHHVLELDGDESYVELPSNIFNDLTEATVEGWVKWLKLGNQEAFFDFGQDGQEVYLGRTSETTALSAGVAPRPDQNNAVTVQNFLQTNEWCHVALVTGPGGIRLYLNGLFAGGHPYTGSFAAIRSGEHNYVGRNPSREAQTNITDLAGQICELRVWKVARTAEEIQADLFKPLTGQEPALVGLWSFADGTARDLSPHHYDGKLRGSARVVPGSRPKAADIPQRAGLVGRVMSEAGKPLYGVNLQVEQAGVVIGQGETDYTGRFVLMVNATNPGLYDISATLGDKGDWRLETSLPLGHSTEVKFALKDAVSLAGSVLTLDPDVPQVAVVVQALREAPESGTAAPANGGLPRLDPVAATTLTDEKGRFKFVNLRPGHYEVRCQVPGGFVYYEQPRSFEVVLGKTTQGVDWRLAPVKKGTWRNFTFRDGLPHNTIRGVATDAQGLIWLATAGGISRYDGRAFSNLSISQVERKGPTADEVNAIHIAPSGALWFGTDSGVSLFDQGVFSPNLAAEGLATNRVLCVGSGGENIVWYGTDGAGASRFDGTRLK